MGLLTAFADGASRGLSVLGDGMLKGIERDADQAIWEKRQALLQQIQRENAKGMREDQAAFDDKRFPVKLDQERQTVTARGEAQTAADAARLRDPGLIGAQDEAAKRNLEREIAALDQRRNDPRIQAAEKAEIDRKLDILRRETDIRTRGQVNAAVGSARGVQQVRDEAEAKGRVNPVLQKIKDHEEVTGKPLPQDVRTALADAYIGINKAADGKQIAAATETVLKRVESGDITAQQAGTELRTLLQSLNSATAKPTLEQVDAASQAALKAGESLAEVNKDRAEKGFPPLPDSAAPSKVTSGTGLIADRNNQAAPRDVIGNQPIGPLTRQADIEESAKAGNKRAIEYLKQQERARIENATTPRDAASMMNG